MSSLSIVVQHFWSVIIESFPDEIVSQGEAALKIYLSSCGEGTAVTVFLRVDVVGRDGAGKTSLTKSLTLQEFDPDEPSTRGINIDPRCQIIVREACDWTTRLTSQYYQQMYDRNITTIVADKLDTPEVKGQYFTLKKEEGPKRGKRKKLTGTNSSTEVKIQAGTVSTKAADVVAVGLTPADQTEQGTSVDMNDTKSSFEDDDIDEKTSDMSMATNPTSSPLSILTPLLQSDPAVHGTDPFQVHGTLSSQPVRNEDSLYTLPASVPVTSVRMPCMLSSGLGHSPKIPAREPFITDTADPLQFRVPHQFQDQTIPQFTPQSVGDQAFPFPSSLQIGVTSPATILPPSGRHQFGIPESHLSVMAPHTGVGNMPFSMPFSVPVCYYPREPRFSFGTQPAALLAPMRATQSQATDTWLPSRTVAPHVLMSPSNYVSFGDTHSITPSVTCASVPAGIGNLFHHAGVPYHGSAFEADPSALSVYNRTDLVSHNVSPDYSMMYQQYETTPNVLGDNCLQRDFSPSNCWSSSVPIATEHEYYQPPLNAPHDSVDQRSDLPRPCSLSVSVGNLEGGHPPALFEAMSSANTALPANTMSPDHFQTEHNTRAAASQEVHRLSSSQSHSTAKRGSGHPLSNQGKKRKNSNTGLPSLRQGRKRLSMPTATSNGTSQPEKGTAAGTEQKSPTARSNSKKKKKQSATVEAIPEQTNETTTAGQTPTIPEHIKKAVSDFLRNKKSRETAKNEIAVTVLDYAGQNVFYATHYLVLSKAGFYYVVFDASQPLEGKTPSIFRVKKGEIVRIPYFDNETNFDRVEEWISAIHVMEPEHEHNTRLFEELGIASPAIFLVGTHADEMEKQPGLLESQEAFILTKLKNSELFGHIVRASEDRICFYVDNTITNPNSGTVDPQVRLLRKKTEDVARKMAQHHRLPITWMKFEQEVRETKEKDKSKKTASVEELLQLAMTTVGMKSREELKVLLHYLSNRTVILYHPKALKSCEEEVVLDVEWLISRLEKVITIQTDVPPMLMKDVNRSVEKGIMTASLVQYLLSDSGSSKNLIISLMSYFDLLCQYGGLEQDTLSQANDSKDFLRLGEQQEGSPSSPDELDIVDCHAYFIPCLLEKPVSLESKSVGIECKTMPLHLWSYPLRVPLPLFYRLLTVFCKHFRCLPVLYRNVGYFHIFPGHRLEFALNRYSFRMTVLSETNTTPNSDFCVAVREYVVRVIDMAKQRGMPGLKLQLGYDQDKSSSASHSDVVDFISLDGYPKDRQVLFSNVTQRQVQPPKDLALWYPSLLTMFTVS